jgi:hypothetical protein
MKKFYVQSGNLREVIMADSPHDACHKAILIHLSKGIPTTLDSYFCVDERGFRDLLLAHFDEEIEPK